MSGERVWAIFEESGEYSDYRASVVEVVTGTEEEAGAACRRLLEQAAVVENEERRVSGWMKPIVLPESGETEGLDWYDAPSFTPIPFDLVPATLVPAPRATREGDDA